MCGMERLESHEEEKRIRKILTFVLALSILSTSAETETGRIKELG